MARPKGKLFALLAVFAAIGLVAASGAFTTVEADRTADVNVAGDDSALLSIESNDTAGNGAYLTGGGSDEVEFDLTAGANNNEELNLNATTNISSVITVANQGSQEVNLTISLSGDNPNLVSINETGTNNDLTSTNVTLGVGDKVTLDVVIDTTQDTTLTDGDEIIDTITFEANAT
jgi:hypothetical protein